MGGGSQQSAVNQAIGGANSWINWASSYNPTSGKVTADSSTYLGWLNEGLGQINGTNAARHAAGQAGDAVIAANAQAQTLLGQQQQQNQVRDVQASSTAAGIRATAAAASRNSPATTTPLATPGGANYTSSPERDFLGL